MSSLEKLTIGVLALQGDFAEHREMLKKIGVKVIEVRKAEELDQVSGLIMPGGESTAISLIWETDDFASRLKEKIAEGKMPVYGTCAGAILLSKKITGKIIPQSLKVLDIEILRNAYGSQIDSFIEEMDIPKLAIKKFPAVFIRAPIIKKVGPKVDVLVKRKNGEIVLAREGNILVSTFHPELTDNPAIHEYFVEMCR